jgi:GTPase SAR1 family protein
MSENNLERRSIIVVGKTGVGKSTICNKIIGRNVFQGSSVIESCTKRVESNVSKVKFLQNRNSQSIFELKVFDTPGFDDSRGRSEQFLNEIALTILKEPLNLIILIVEYGKFSTSARNNIEVLRECLNDFSQSSLMIIINDVPLERILEKKRSEGEEVRDREKVLEETFEKYSKALGCSFKYQFFLQNHDYFDDINDETYNAIKEVIFNCSSFIDTSNVRTWDEIVKIYSSTITSDEQELKVLMKRIMDEIKDKISKIEFDIAHIKYSFLRSTNLMTNNLLNAHKKFVQNFECAFTEEDYSKRNNFPMEKLAKYATVSGTVGTVGATAGITGAILVGISAPILLPLSFILLGFSTISSFTSDIVFHKNFKNIREKLTFLDEKRAELKEEQRRCQSSIDELKKQLDERKEKINRLERTLVIQTQAIVA